MKPKGILYIDMKNILHVIKHFFHHVDNLIYWFPVIWNQQEWDHDYFYRLLRKKLERMEIFYRSQNAQHLYADKDAENIHYCVVRLDRLINSNYMNQTLDEVFYKEFPGYHDKSEWKDLDCGLTEWVSNDTSEESELWHKCFEISEKLREDDLDELFAQLRLHIQEWWD